MSMLFHKECLKSMEPIKKAENLMWSKNIPSIVRNKDFFNCLLNGGKTEVSHQQNTNQLLSTCTTFFVELGPLQNASDLLKFIKSMGGL